MTKLPKTDAAIKQKCSAIVQSSGGFHFYACSRPPNVSIEGKLYCAVHDPMAVAGREKKKEETWKIKHAQEMIRWNGPRFLKALREIADGCPDPRNVARDAIKGYEK